MLLSPVIFLLGSDCSQNYFNLCVSTHRSALLGQCIFEIIASWLSNNKIDNDHVRSNDYELLYHKGITAGIIVLCKETPYPSVVLLLKALFIVCRKAKMAVKLHIHYSVAGEKIITCIHLNTKN